MFKWNGENISSNDECCLSNEPNLKEVDYDTSIALSSNITTRTIAFCRMNNVKECCSLTSNGYEACSSNRKYECSILLNVKIKKSKKLKVAPDSVKQYFDDEAKEINNYSSKGTRALYKLSY